MSWRILTDDLRDGTTAAPVTGTSLRAYARLLHEQAGQAARLGEFEHWAAALAPGGELDPARHTIGLTVGQTREHELRLPPEVTGPLLSTVPAAAGADVTTALVAALRIAVSRWRAGRGADTAAPLTVDLERHGREEFDGTDLSRTVGWFTSVAPVRLPAVPDGPQALAEVHRLVTAAPGNGIGFGLLRYANARTAPALARLGTPQVLFNYLGRFPAASEVDWDTAAEADALRTKADPDLGTPYLLEINAACHATAAGPELRAVLTYADEGLDIPGLAAHWADAMRDLCAPVDEQWPLSPLQEGLYVQASLAGDADVYIAQNVVRLRPGASTPGAAPRPWRRCWTGTRRCGRLHRPKAAPPPGRGPRPRGRRRRRTVVEGGDVDDRHGAGTGPAVRPEPRRRWPGSPSCAGPTAPTGCCSPTTSCCGTAGPGSWSCGTCSPCTPGRPRPPPAGRVHRLPAAGSPPRTPARPAPPGRTRCGGARPSRPCSTRGRRHRGRSSPTGIARQLTEVHDGRARRAGPRPAASPSTRCSPPRSASSSRTRPAAPTSCSAPPSPAAPPSCPASTRSSACSSTPSRPGSASTPARPVADLLRRVQADRLDLMPHEYLGLGEIQRRRRSRSSCSTPCTCCRTSSTTTRSPTWRREHGHHRRRAPSTPPTTR